MRQMMKAGLKYSLLLCFFFLIGCGQAEEAVESTAGEVKNVAKEAATTTAENFLDNEKVQLLLAKADELDGDADKVIKKCPSCMLGMDGMEEFQSSVGTYTVYSCSEHCKEALDGEPAKVLKKIKIPEA